MTDPITMEMAKALLNWFMGLTTVYIVAMTTCMIYMRTELSAIKEWKKNHSEAYKELVASLEDADDPKENDS